MIQGTAVLIHTPDLKSKCLGSMLVLKLLDMSIAYFMLSHSFYKTMISMISVAKICLKKGFNSCRLFLALKLLQIDVEMPNNKIA